MSQHLSFLLSGKAPEEEKAKVRIPMHMGRNPTVRDRKEACGDVEYGGG